VEAKGMMSLEEGAEVRAGFCGALRVTARTLEKRDKLTGFLPGSF
jgi:hypothetical protein